MSKWGGWGGGLAAKNEGCTAPWASRGGVKANPGTWAAFYSIVKFLYFQLSERERKDLAAPLGCMASVVVVGP